MILVKNHIYYSLLDQALHSSTKISIEKLYLFENILLYWFSCYFLKNADKSNLGDLWGRPLQINSKHKKRIASDFGDVHNNVIRFVRKFENTFSRSFEQTVIKTHITTLHSKIKVNSDIKTMALNKIRSRYRLVLKMRTNH